MGEVTRYVNDEYGSAFEYWNGEKGGNSCRILVLERDGFKAGLLGAFGNGNAMTEKEAKEANELTPQVEYVDKDFMESACLSGMRE